MQVQSTIKEEKFLNEVLHTPIYDYTKMIQETGEWRFRKKYLNYKHYTEWLIKYQKDYFEFWYDKDLINPYYTPLLAKFIPQKFNVWFDKNTYNYGDCMFINGSQQLVLNFPKKFDIWFDKEKFDYGYNLEYLSRIYKTRKFKGVKEKFVWTGGATLLIEKLLDKFEIWFDVEKFPPVITDRVIITPEKLEEFKEKVKEIVNKEEIEELKLKYNKLYKAIKRSKCNYIYNIFELYEEV